MGATTGLAILGAAGIGMKAFGQYQQGLDIAAAEDYNAAVLRQQAKQRRQQGEVVAAKQRREARVLKSRQEVLFTKAGVALTGSALEVINDSAAEAELDAMMIEYNAEVGARGSETDANLRESRADLARITGAFNAGTTLLTEGVSLAGKTKTGQ